MKTLLCFGVILGLHCLVQGVHSDDQTAKRSYAKRDRPSDDGYSAIVEDKILFKTESPLRGRKIHRTAWSEEEVSDEFGTAEGSDSWNFGRLYSYLKSLIRETEEMERARMTPGETVAMIRKKIKSEIKARKMEDSRERLTTYRTDYLTENSESSEDNDESCGEDGDSEMHDNKERGVEKENGAGVDEEDCYGDEVSEERGSSKQESEGSADAKKDEATSSADRTIKERKQSVTQTKSNQLSGQEITVLNGTNTKSEENIQRKTTSTPRTGSGRKFSNTPSTTKSMVKTNKDKKTVEDSRIASSTTYSDVRESTVVINPLHTNSGHETSTNQFVQTETVNQDKVHFNVATGSNVMPTQSEFIANSGTLLKKITTPGIATPEVTNVKSATEVLPQDNFEVIIKAPEFIPIDNKEVAKTGTSPNKVTEVDQIQKMPHVYGEQREVQKVDGFNADKSEVSSSKRLQTKGDQSEILDTTAKSSVADSISFAPENTSFQQESFFKYGSRNDILEEYNLKNEYIELSDDQKNEFRNILRDYNAQNQKSDVSQHSSVSQNSMNLNEGNTKQESFDTILEFLYKHSKNPLILSLKNANETLF